MTIIITPIVIDALKKLYNKYNNKEVAGHFKNTGTGNDVLINQIEEIKIGNKYSSDSGDWSYTFHTHPSYTECYTYYLSPEDLIGVVQDNIRNEGYFANPKGINIFDIMINKGGFYIYYPLSKAISKWQKDEKKVLRQEEDYENFLFENSIKYYFNEFINKYPDNIYKFCKMWEDFGIKIHFFPWNKKSITLNLVN